MAEARRELLTQASAWSPIRFSVISEMPLRCSLEFTSGFGSAGGRKWSFSSTRSARLCPKITFFVSGPFCFENSGYVGAAAAGLPARVVIAACGPRELPRSGEARVTEAPVPLHHHEPAGQLREVDLEAPAAGVQLNS